MQKLVKLAERVTAMLSEARNRLLTEVGPGTPMGELLRRYWQPIAAVAELDDNADQAGAADGRRPGALQGPVAAATACSTGTARIAAPTSPTASSRSAGCAATTTAGCSTRPAPAASSRSRTSTRPRSRFRDQIRIKAYPVEAKAGLLWAYLGPEPAPLLPNWEPFTWNNGFVQIVFSEVPCNWFQCQENSIDPVHFEWMHGNWSAPARRATTGRTRHAISSSASTSSTTASSIGACARTRTRRPAVDRRPRLPVAERAVHRQPLRMARADRRHQHAERRLVLHPRAARSASLTCRTAIPYWYAPINDEKTGRWITSHIMNQDFVAWVGQGAITDRRREHLGAATAASS